MRGGVTKPTVVTLPVMNWSSYAVPVRRSSPPLIDREACLARRVMQVAPARDLEAEADLYRALAPRIRLYGLKHLRDAHAAQDLAQDVMMLTLERLRRGELREPERITSFVLGTSRQTVIDLKRGRQRRERILDAYSEDAPMGEASSAPTLDLERLQLCLQRLSERERTVVVMTFFDDSSAAEVSVALGISTANVRVIRHRSVEHLRACIEGKAAPRA